MTNKSVRSRNREKVMFEAAEIVRRLRETDVTQGALMREYKCGHALIMVAVLSQISLEEWVCIQKKKRAQGSLKGGTRFKRGHIPWIKGKKGLHLSPETEFKPGGTLRGQAARNWVPVGTIKTWHDKLPKRRRQRRGPKRKDGTKRMGKPRRWIKVRDDGPMPRRWIPYARYLWEQKYGPVPDGHLVRHQNGNQMDDSLDNLHLVNRANNLRLNHQLHPEMRKIAHALAVKSRKRNTKARQQFQILFGPKIIIWECTSCREDFEQRKQPKRCPKCGGFSFEINSRKEKIG